MSDFSPNAFDALANDNPQFANGSPGLAYDTFSVQNADLAVPAVAATALTATNADAATQHAKSNGFQIWSWLGARIGDIGNTPGIKQFLQYANKPLQEVQQDYKFLHSVYSRHGFMSGFLATLGVAGAGMVGAAAGPEGAILGSELGASLERRFMGNAGYADSYADSQNPDYKVSFGRDVANLAGQVPGFSALKSTDTGIGKYVSGGLDAAADLSIDPLSIGGGVKAAVRQGKYLERATPDTSAQATAGLVGTQSRLRIPAGPSYAVPSLFRVKFVQDFLVAHNQKVLNSEGMDYVRWGTTTPDATTAPVRNSYNRSVQDIWDKISNNPPVVAAGQIVNHYPALRGVAADLTKLKGGPDAVHAYLRDAYTATQEHNLIFGPAMLPSKTLLRPLADKLKTGAWNVEPTTTDAAGNVLPDADRIHALDQRGILANQRNFFFPRRVTDPDEMVPDKSGVTLKAKRSTLAPVIAKPFDADAWGSAIAKKVRTFTGYSAYAISPKLDDLSGKSFDLRSPEALEGIYRNLRYALGASEAARRVGRIALLQNREGGPDIGALRNAWHAAQVEIVKAAGVPADADIMAKVVNKVRQVTDDPAGVLYAPDHLGNDHSDVLTDTGSRPMAVDQDQTNFAGAFVDFRALHGAMHDLGMLSKVYGKADDFYSSKFINGFFKPLALGTAGFALRIAAAEAIPAAMRYGGVNMLKARVDAIAAGMGVKLLNGEAGHAAANAVMALPGQTAHAALLAGQSPDHIRSVLDASGVNGPVAMAKASLFPIPAAVIRAKVGPGLIKWANSWDPEGFDVAVRAALKHEGYIGNDITRTGHLLDNDARGRSEQEADFVAQHLAAPHAAATKNGQKYIQGDKYGRWSPGNEHFSMHWTLELQKMSQQLPHQQIAQDVLHELNDNGASVERAWTIARAKEAARMKGVQYDPTKPGAFGAPLAKADDIRAVERPNLERYSITRPDGIIGQDPTEFATARIARLRGATTGMDGTTHSNLLEQIARGEKPELGQVENIDHAKSPWQVFGRELVQMPGTNPLNRVIQGGFKRVIDPIINSLSRQPLYVAAVKTEMRSLRHAIDKGALSEDDAFNIAELRATHAILPQIHNTALRTQFSVMANSFMPFYFAQEQAVKRTLHLIRSDPSAVRKYQLLYEGITNPAFVQDDGQGNRFLMLPGLGAIGNATNALSSTLGLDTVGGLPMTVQGNMQSLKTVLPELQMPGVSPFISIAAQSLAKFNPAWDRALTKAVGQQAMTSDLLDWAIPNSPVRNIVRGLRADESDRSFQNAYMTAYAAAYYHGQVPPANASKFEKQAFLDRLKNNARSIFMVKAVLGMASPLAPQVSESDFTRAGKSFNQEFSDMITANKGDYIKALNQFVTEHGNASVSYTVSKSEAAVRGAYLPYTNQAINWIQNNQGLMTSALQTGAAFLVPQAPGTGNIQAIHDELIQLALRQRDTPEEFMNAVYVAAGDNAIAPVAKEHQGLVQSLTDAGDKAGASAERARYAAFLQQFGIANPIWYDDYQSSDKTHLAQKALDDLGTIFANPDKVGPGFETDQVAQVRNLYTQYVQFTQALNDAPPTQSKAVKTAWESYLTNLEAAQPTLAPVIRTVFLRLAHANG